MRHHLVLRVVSKMLIPFILLFGLYVQFHGDFGPQRLSSWRYFCCISFYMRSSSVMIRYAVVPDKALILLVPLGLLITL